MDQNKFPLAPQSEEQKLADSHMVAMRAFFGDERAEHLAKVCLTLVQYIVTRTNDPREGLQVICNVKESLELAVKQTSPKENDPSSN